MNLRQAYIDAAMEIADLARGVSLKYFRQPLHIEQKGDDSPVTIADRQTEALIRDEITRRFPEHGFYGEESGQNKTDAQWLWVVDPIDGTTSFSTGKPTFGTLIALLFEGEPVLGVIDMPALDDRWLGVKGAPTLFNGKPVQCDSQCKSQCDGKQKLKDCSVYTTTTKMFDQAAMPSYLALSSQCKFSVYGADCMAYGLLASGFTEIVVEASLQPYDYMAVVPVVCGAGGAITDWQGEAVRLGSGDQIIATANNALHQQALAALQNAKIG